MANLMLPLPWLQQPKYVYSPVAAASVRTEAPVAQWQIELRKLTVNDLYILFKDKRFNTTIVDHGQAGQYLINWIDQQSNRDKARRDVVSIISDVAEIRELKLNSSQELENYHDDRNDDFELSYMPSKPFKGSHLFICHVNVFDEYFEIIERDRKVYPNAHLANVEEMDVQYLNLQIDVNELERKLRFLLLNMPNLTKLFIATINVVNLDLHDLSIAELTIRRCGLLQNISLNTQSLKSLYLEDNNKLVTLNLNGASRLSSLHLSNNYLLGNLIFDNLTNLRFLDIEGGKVTKLDLKNTPNLNSLSVKQSPTLSVLTINANLTNLTLHDTGIRTLSFPQDTVLSYLSLRNNKELQRLDLTGVTTKDVNSKIDIDVDPPQFIIPKHLEIYKGGLLLDIK